MMLSAKMMLDYLGEQESASRLENAILKVLKEGKNVTGDLGGNASTMEMSEAIKNAL